MAPAPVSPPESGPVSRQAWAMLGRTDLEASTCWDFPSRDPDHAGAGDSRFHGATPAPCAVNLVRRYSRPGDLVVDPMAGSGTISDVAQALGRRPVSFDLVTRRRDILRADARAWPVRSSRAALVVIDSPYSDNIRYGSDARCLGRISCREPRFYEEISRVASEAHRVLRPGGVLAWIISDEYRHGIYTPLGFRLLAVLERSFEPVDTIALVRRNDRSASAMWQHRARRYNFFLRGFKCPRVEKIPSIGGSRIFRRLAPRSQPYRNRTVRLTRGRGSAAMGLPYATLMVSPFSSRACLSLWRSSRARPHPRARRPDVAPFGRRRR